MKIRLRKDVNVQFRVRIILKTQKYCNSRYFLTYIIFFLKLRICYILQPKAEFLAEI